MAIQFARCEYVSRSKGGNVCRKASYNQRTEIRCERTGELFSFQEREGNVHHEVLLPEGADLRFKNSSVLWNEAERCERRKDSQVAKEFVLALPDDKQISLEDRIELTRRFAETHFIEKGLGVQLDVHEPDEHEKNWHAHLLVTTRRFREDGLSFEKSKARDLDPTIRKGCVIEADIWGELWRDLQNTYFEEKGYELRVDPIGLVPQEHLGPVRMRHHLSEAVSRSQMLQKANVELAQDPQSILEALMQNCAVFSQKDVESFLKKHVSLEKRECVLEGVFSHPSLVPLYHKDTGQRTAYFTTHNVRAEEEKLLRFADKIANKSAPVLSPEAIAKGIEGRALSEEQHKAYELCVQSGQNLSLIQGRAGVGKSYVLDGIRMAHENEGYRVLGLAPTHKVASDLRESGFKDAKTCHGFLFAFKNNKEALDSQTLVVIDEAGMLGTELSVELFHAVKKSGAKLILVGDDRQMSSVHRGGIFRILADRYSSNSAELRDVRRQTIHWQKKVSEDLSKGEVRSAVNLLQENKVIQWTSSKEEALSSLLEAWAKERVNIPTTQILAQKKVDVDALNRGAREILRQQGDLGDLEVTCVTQRGRINFAEGDRIQLTKTDKDQGLKSGYFGIVEYIDPETKKLILQLDNKEKVMVDPHTYDGLRHGYAATVYKAQGSTLDHVYVLHSNTINQPTNYVALTRQTKSLSLYVSKDKAPTEASLIFQMSREERHKTSLLFDTQKDIERRQEEKPFTARLKHKTEDLVTKVKDVFHDNKEFYKVDIPLAKTEEVTLITVQNAISPALQSVYEEMKHPAFSRATIVKKTFEEGYKLYGEEKAIAYWESKKEAYFHLYQQKLNQVEKEFTSPFLSYMSDKSRDLARNAAQTDPDRALKFLKNRQASKKAEQEAKDIKMQRSQEQTQNSLKERIPSFKETQKIKSIEDIHQKEFTEAFSAYFRFKELKYELKKSPEDEPYLKAELRKLGKSIYKNKEAFEHIQRLDPDMSQSIQKAAAQEKAKIHSLDRGGYSL
ncbi:MAG: hypothetical protein BGO67_05270 [Alphaproteobacteria bacterium 41-28]|nr:MAG: hypothetical protein BGO67_05270 [Alphaproteobacteria bacterium 41-28]